jgi:hypothetical protein
MQISVSLSVWGASPKVAALRQLPVGQWWREGDAVPGRGIVRPENGWGIASDVQGERALEEHLRRLRAQVEPHQVQIREAILAGHGHLAIGVDVAGMTSALYVPPDLVGWIGGLGCEVEFDAYTTEPHRPGAVL